MTHSQRWRLRRLPFFLVLGGLIMLTITFVAIARMPSPMIPTWATSSNVISPSDAIKLLSSYLAVQFGLAIVHLLAVQALIEAGPITPAPCTHPSDPAAAQVMAATAATRSGAGTSATEAKP